MTVKSGNCLVGKRLHVEGCGARVAKYRERTPSSLLLYPIVP